MGFMDVNGTVHYKTVIWLKNAVALRKNRTVWAGLKQEQKDKGL